MDRKQAEREQNRLSAEHPDATWIIAEADGDWQVLRVGITPAQVPTGTEIAAKPRPETPDSPPPPSKQQVNPYWGV
ncbi:MAG: hypothetical protein FJW90_09690 [Actinobacteria bacterium]|nr:hypothetical protein [Actinomycetota bacterium]